MTKNIFFSVVIPTYNRSLFINKTVTSVLNQTYDHFEIIIVDDGSIDDTEEVVKNIEDPRIKYFWKENKERGAARNAGAKLAKGQYVNFFDSDDLLYQTHLEEAVKVINEKNSPEVFHLGFDIKKSDKTLIKQVNNFSGDLETKLLSGNCLSCNGVFIRSDIALIMPFSEERKLSALEDWELWLRLASRYTIHYSNLITSTVINHEERSVLMTEKDGLIKRSKLLINSLKMDPVFMSSAGAKLNILQASLFTYVSLHLAITKNHRYDTIRYLLKGISLNPREMFKRRFLAILKHLI